jgi:putative DNA methylase
MLVPKSEELIVNPYRFDGNRDASNDFYQAGMQRAFTCMRKTTVSNFPLTIYYAYKQNDNVIEENTVEVSSNGWETMLNGLISAGFSITGTWPLRTERTGGFRNKDQNALASSIAIVCRPRSEDAPSTTRRDFLSELREALKNGLHDLQSGNIAPVDLAQASIGPGMAVYSKYSEVLEADGTPMSVRDALVLINQELDAYLSAQEGNMDTNSRFCIAWYEQYGLSSGKYGDADTLARAKMAHLQELVDDGVLESGRGNVRLKRRDELPDKWDSSKEETIWTIVQQLCHTLETQGLDPTAKHMLNLSTLSTDKIENAKALAYRAYITAERKGYADEALAYNSLVTAWPDLVERMTKLKDISPEQMRLDF